MEEVIKSLHLAFLYCLCDTVIGPKSKPRGKNDNCLSGFGVLWWGNMRSYATCLQLRKLPENDEKYL